MRVLLALAAVAACVLAAPRPAPYPHGSLVATPPRSNLTDGAYDPALAYLGMLLSGAAYSEDPQSCLRGMKETADFLVTSTSETACDWAQNHCFAFTAVSNSQQMVVLSFRGSANAGQIVMEVLETLTAPTRSVPCGGQVQDYFYNGYTGMQDAISSAMQDALQQYPSYTVFVTGHSLGGSLASIAAADLACAGVISNPVQYTYGEPRTGNSAFAQSHDDLTAAAYRVVHYRDIVPHVPPCDSLGGGGCSPKGNAPYHHGVEVFFDQPAMPTDGTGYEICLGTPTNEDASCSDRVIMEKPCVDFDTCVCYHTHYFDTDVAGLCSGGDDCPCCS